MICLATDRTGDSEIAERIALHRAKRPGGWGLIEEPMALVAALRTHAASNRCLEADCLAL